MRQLTFLKNEVNHIVNQVSKEIRLSTHNHIIDTLLKRGKELLDLSARHSQMAMLLGSTAKGYNYAKKVNHVYLSRLDNKPRFEITDNTAKVGKIPSTLTPLSKVFDHPVLYKNYPQLKNVWIKEVNYPHDPNKPEILGQSFSSPRMIYVSADLPTSEKKSVIVHEIQHEIQSIEGWKTGTKLGPEYLSNSGEREARDSESRTDMTSYERMLHPSFLLNSDPYHGK